MKRLRDWRYWTWLRDGAIFLVLLFGIRWYQKRDMPQGAAPDLTGKDLHGASVSLAGYRGQPVLVHFWATWCGVCKAEQSNIDALSRDLPVLSVASKSGEVNEVATYVQENAVAPSVVVDPDGELARRFGVHLFPSTFVIDGTGAIRHVEVGYSTQVGLRARMWLAKFSPLF